jgi:hypothetical protein
MRLHPSLDGSSGRFDLLIHRIGPDRRPQHVPTRRPVPTLEAGAFHVYTAYRIGPPH